MFFSDCCTRLNLGVWISEPLQSSRVVRRPPKKTKVIVLIMVGQTLCKVVFVFEKRETSKPDPPCWFPRTPTLNSQKRLEVPDHFLGSPRTGEKGCHFLRTHAPGARGRADRKKEREERKTTNQPRRLVWRRTVRLSMHACICTMLRARSARRLVCLSLTHRCTALTL
jgi:hypothetical protein